MSGGIQPGFSWFRKPQERRVGTADPRPGARCACPPYCVAQELQSSSQSRHCRPSRAARLGADRHRLGAAITLYRMRRAGCRFCGRWRRAVDIEKAPPGSQAGQFLSARCLIVPAHIERRLRQTHDQRSKPAIGDLNPLFTLSGQRTCGAELECTSVGAKQPETAGSEQGSHSFRPGKPSPTANPSARRYHDRSGIGWPADPEHRCGQCHAPRLETRQPRERSARTPHLSPASRRARPQLGLPCVSRSSAGRAMASDQSGRTHVPNHPQASQRSLVACAFPLPGEQRASTVRIAKPIAPNTSRPAISDGAMLSMAATIAGQS